MADQDDDILGRVMDREAAVHGEGSVEPILDVATARPPLGLRSA